MKARIKIGEQEVMMEANAYTPVIYRECFPGRDIFRELIQIEELEEKSEIDMGIYERLGYAMSCANEKGVSFREWMAGFEPMDLFMASAEIMDLWNGNAVGLSEDEESKK